MTPEQYCQEKAGGSGSSFYYSFLFLPPPNRRAITALYAFCREVDDVVDNCHDPETAKTTLAWWHQEIDNTFKQRPQHPVSKALLPAVRNYGLAQEHFHAIIEGMEMDLVKTRYANFEELGRYCYHVASVVGLLSATIFGYRDKVALDYAKHLGTAFQLTNIIRDVGEDARRNRIYLPTEDLIRFEVKATDIIHGKESENFYALMKFQSERANQYYEQAMALLPDIDRMQQLPGLIMASIYLALLQEINKDGFHVLHQRIALTPVRKLWLAWKTLRKEKRLHKKRPAA